MQKVETPIIHGNTRVTSTFFLESSKKWQIQNQSMRQRLSNPKSSNIVKINVSFSNSFFTAWDTEDIDKWHIEPFTPEQLAGHFLEESSFATLFPKYREMYLKEVWPLVTNTLQKHVFFTLYSYKSGHCLCIGLDRRQHDRENDKKDL
jgi:hypothetical protein